MIHESPLAKYFHRSDHNFKTDHSHKEAWCKACVAYKVREIKHTELTTGQPERGDEDVEKEVMTIHIEPRSNKVEWYRKHLIEQCPHVTDEVRAEAVADAARGKRKAAETKMTRLQHELSQNENRPVASGPVASPLSAQSSLSSIASADSDALLTSTVTGGQSLLAPASAPAPEVDYDKWIMAAESSGDTEQAEALRYAKRQRLGTINGTPFFGETVPKLQSWNNTRQREFSSDLCCLLIACNIAWHAVEVPYWQHFFQKWVPGCLLLWRLTRRASYALHPVSIQGDLSTECIQSGDEVKAEDL
ncbi:uncharacterized protein B0H18DRAFT_1205946 [Fomitopsis serialis]|uniref:uncharacterized protein n=1 Tax=Fomitopsis serialis TaxID=139415 RepID=UPI002007B3FA|nr:uncharacterized protein B0H18DRAFT_1205946 [Neoantrodia serialis]KAH9937023.1 hypothetical protein B0H18DRAFT_1205946 [Neoantrodia serialis]